MQLLHVVQIAPRISWTRAGEILGLSASTVATRWDRLHTSGVAWTAVQPNPLADDFLGAFVDIVCRASRRARIIADLCQDPRVVSLEECAQGRDLLATVIVSDHAMLSRLLLDDLGSMPGLTRATCRVITGLHSGGSDWRIGTLDAQQQREALRDALPQHRGPAGSLGPTDKALAAALCRDPRAPIADLARDSGLTPATARRHLHRILAGGVLTIRCDMAAQFAGWPLSCSIYGRVGASDKQHAIDALTNLSQVRMCMSVTGDANLIVSGHARTVSGLADLEATMAAAAPAFQHLDSALELRTHKRMGWLLDHSGRSTGAMTVPVGLIGEESPG